MGAIYLIRHGQASFGKANYDKLSTKGCEQSQILGEFMGSMITANKYYAGDLLRHDQTLNHFIKGAGNTDVSMVTHSGFNEFNHLEILARYDEKWKDSVSMSTKLAALPDGNKLLQKQFTNALYRWINADQENDTATQQEYTETWSQFKTRCIKALDDVIKQYLTVKHAIDNSPVAKDVLIFTSGGPISVIVQHVLGLNDEQTLMLNQQLRNTGVTKLLFSEDNLSVDYFNNYSHLERKSAEWITYR